MPKLYWSLESLEILSSVPRPVREDILSKTRHLVEFPEMFPIRQRGRFRGYRFFPSFDWIVYYVVQDDAAIILTIGHAKRREM